MTSQSNSASGRSDAASAAAEPMATWAIFICYRRIDGSAAAQFVREMLDQRVVEITDELRSKDPGLPLNVRLEVFLDTEMPGVANWKAVHEPSLKRAKALIVVCTPGAKLRERGSDWVHYELDWWARNRHVAPILIDPLLQGPRFVPDSILRRWPDINRVQLPLAEFTNLSPAEVQAHNDKIFERIVNVLLPSSVDILTHELNQNRRRVRYLLLALTAVLLLLLVAGWQWLVAQEAQFKAEAARAEAEAARAIAERAEEETRLALVRTEEALERANEERQASERSVYELMGAPDTVDTAVAAMLAAEGASPESYETLFRHPFLRGGITIGIGYDLGYETREAIAHDWEGLLDTGVVARLVELAGLRGAAAKARLKDLQDIDIPYDVALRNFRETRLTQMYSSLLRSVPDVNKAPIACQMAMLSLVSNIGVSGFDAPGERYREMRDLKAAIGARQFERIPDFIRSMGSLRPDLPPFVERREREAQICEFSLRRRER